MISEEETHKQQVERREQTKREEEAKLKNRLLETEEQENIKHYSLKWTV